MTYLSESEKRRVRDRYSLRYQAHGIDVATLKSGGAAKQFVRHSVHASLFDLKGKRVLDIGCGIAMFYQFILAKNIPIESYTGIDILEPFLAANRNRFPECRFEAVDIFREPLEPFAPDVVFMSQVFNNIYQEQNNQDIACTAMSRTFAAAKCGIVIDFISTYVDFEDRGELFYFSPEKMFSFARTLTRFVSLRHDYLPFEFTLALYKAPTQDLNSVAQSAKLYDSDPVPPRSGVAP